MEDKRILKFAIKHTVFVLLLVFSVPVFAHAYAVTAHKALTAKTIKEFNKLSDIKIPSDSVKYFLKGVDDEDNMQTSRPLYHFYDPNRPLSVAGLSDAQKTCAGIQQSKTCKSAPL